MAVDTNIDFTNFEKDPRHWFVQQGAERELPYFLAHDDEGVIWGRIEEGKLWLSGEAFPNEVAVPLRVLTLQQARLFGEEGELLVWRGEAGKWYGRYLSDTEVEDGDMLDETHLLWGEASDPPGSQDGFILMRDGVQGLLHAPPLKLARGEHAALQVRHYLDYDDEGQAYIALSRLVAVIKGGK